LYSYTQIVNRYADYVQKSSAVKYQQKKERKKTVAGRARMSKKATILGSCKTCEKEKTARSREN
jgi:hypothetical protein